MATEIELMEQINHSMAKLDKLDGLDSIIAKFNEKTAVPAKAVETSPSADMEESKVLGGITKAEVFGIPIGQVAVGTFGGVFISELVDGFMASRGTMTKGIVKLIAAGAIGTWGKRWMGKDVSYAIAFVLGVFGLSQVLPIDKWAAALADKVKSMVPGTIKVTGTQTGVLGQADKILHNSLSTYYGSVAGRVG